MKVSDLIERNKEYLKRVGVHDVNFYDVTEVNDIKHKDGFSYVFMFHKPPFTKLLVEILDEDFDKITPLLND